MQKKNLISLSGLLALLFSANLFAYSGHGFKITSETIKSTPGFNFHVKELPVSSVNSYASALTQTANVDGYVKQHIQINGFHDVNISNETDQTQNYAYTCTLTCQDAQGYYTRNVTLQPKGRFSARLQTMGDLQSVFPGSFRINASTAIAGESNAHHEAHATARVRA